MALPLRYPVNLCHEDHSLPWLFEILTLFLIDLKGIVRAIIDYPLSLGRNFE
jgi:alkyl hydroperoxide reductase subunit AhpC